MLNIPTWNRVLIWGVVVLGLAFAMPNLFYDRVERRNDAVTAIEEAGGDPADLAGELGGWPSYLPSSLVNLGLDLRGGAHLLAEVQVEEVYEARKAVHRVEFARMLQCPGGFDITQYTYMYAFHAAIGTDGQVRLRGREAIGLRQVDDASV